MATIDNDKLLQLLALVEEVKSDLNALRTDFLSHDHSSSYNAGVLRMGETPTLVAGPTSTAIVGNVPSNMHDSSR